MTFILLVIPLWFVNKVFLLRRFGVCVGELEISFPLRRGKELVGALVFRLMVGVVLVLASGFAIALANTISFISFRRLILSLRPLMKDTVSLCGIMESICTLNLLSANSLIYKEQRAWRSSSTYSSSKYEGMKNKVFGDQLICLNEE